MNDSENAREQLIREVNELKSRLDPKKVRVLQIDRLENVINKLAQHSDNCSECSNYLDAFRQDLLDNLTADLTMVDKLHLKNYHTNFKSIVTHLCKKHKYVEEGSYVGTYMSIGLSLGMSMGVIIGLMYDKGNGMSIGMSLGMCFGISFGVLVGSMQDSSAKKKGNVI